MSKAILNSGISSLASCNNFKMANIVLSFVPYLQSDVFYMLTKLLFGCLNYLGKKP